MPKNIIAAKNRNTHKFGNGNIVSALGKTLKLNSGPDTTTFSSGIFSCKQK